MSEKDKKDFMKKVTIICDTREQKNQHIISAFDKLNIKHENCKLDYGDYSFKVDDKDFKMSCVVERKGCINELWGNITTDRERFEKELSAASGLARSTNLLIENCSDWNYLKKYEVPDYEMAYQNRKVKEIGERVHNTLRSWSSANRYNFDVYFAKSENESAPVMLGIFYWYWHNYKEAIRPLRK